MASGMDERDATRAGESDGSRPTTGTGDPAPVVVVDNWYFDPAGTAITATPRPRMLIGYMSP